MEKLIKIYSEEWGIKKFGWRKGSRWSIFWSEEKKEYWKISSNKKSSNKIYTKYEYNKKANQAKKHIQNYITLE